MMPNFIIIGAARCGTTSVYQYLRQHPQICMSTIKETNYFAYLASHLPGSRIVPATPWKVTSQTGYRGLFRATKRHIAIGEVSPFYLYAPGVPQLIKKMLPKSRLIVILRDPAERAYSAYIKNLAEGFETRSFTQAIDEEIQGRDPRITTTTYYLRTGQYHHLLSAYLEHFDRHQMQILFYQDLTESPVAFMQSIFTYLGVDTDFTPNISIRFNRGIIPPIKANAGLRSFKGLSKQLGEYLPRNLYFFLLKVQQKVQSTFVPVPELDQNVRRFLRGFFTNDIRKLQMLTGRNLSMWLEA